MAATAEETSEALLAERQRNALVRHKLIQRVLWAILIANWVVAGVKLLLGTLAHSTAMTADGLHSFIDGGSNVIGLVAMRFAAQPADSDHPYGHQKLEALAALAIGVLIGMGALEVGRMAIDAIAHGVHPTVAPLTLAAMVITLIINLIVTRVERHWGRKLNSTLLLADADHTLSDVFVTVAVIASLLASKLGVPRADGIVALAVLAFVVWTGWTIIRRSVAILSDTARLDPNDVARVCTSVPHVLQVHDIRSRGLEDSVYVDLKIHVDPGLTIERAHEASHEVELAITRAYPQVVDVVVHVEPDDHRGTA